MASPGAAATWQQIYDPLGGSVLGSAAVAAIPVVVLLGCLGVLHMRAHRAALLGLAAAWLVAVAAFGMPAALATAAAGYGAAFGLFPIGWIVLNAIFLYDLTVATGQLEVLKRTIAGLAGDRRVQALLIAFAFGAFMEGAAGFGTPVAISAAMLIGLGFRPLEAAGLALIGNTAPVAFGALGTPLLALAAVTGLPLEALSAMVGRQLPFFALLVPFWMIAVLAGLRGVREVWPACLVAGGSFAVAQYLLSNFHGPWLVDVIGSLVSMGALVLLLRVWRPRRIWRFAHDPAADEPQPAPSRREALRAWMPWMLLSALVFLWGLPGWKKLLDGLSVVRLPVPLLHQAVVRVPPVVPRPEPEAAIFTFNYLSASGTAIFLAAVAAGLWLGLRPGTLLRMYGRAVARVRLSLLTIAAMMALGFITRYSGTDTTLGLAFASTGVLFPFFSALLGWLGVALTGSDTSSNVLFGNLQKVSAEQLGISPVLTAAANSSGGVMGKMIDAQSIVVASVATGEAVSAGKILRYVFFHSIALAALVGVVVFLQAYLFPWMVPAP
jgi:lactate permease